MRSTGAYPYRYKKPLAPWARIKLSKTRTDCRDIPEMTVPHHYPASCRAARPQGSSGGSPSGEGRSVKKICLWHIFSVGRSGCAARKPCFLWGSMWPFKVGHNRKCPLPKCPFGYLPGEGKVTRGPGMESPGAIVENDVSSPPARPKLKYHSYYFKSNLPFGIKNPPHPGAPPGAGHPR